MDEVIEFVQAEIPKKLYEQKITELVDHLVKLDGILFPEDAGLKSIKPGGCMKRVGLYIRVSTEEQARIQDGSLVSQRQRLHEYVEGQNRRSPNWGAVVNVYCDEGKSAKDMNRPEFQRLIQDIRMGRINLVLSSELSRLSRSIRDFVSYGISLKSMTQASSRSANNLIRRPLLAK